MSTLLLLLLTLLPAQEPATPSLEQAIEAVESLIEAEAKEYEIGQALLVLAKVEDEGAAVAISKMLGDFNGVLREAAVNALGNCLYDNKYTLLGKVVEKSKQQTERISAGNVLAKSPEGRAWLRKRFKKLKDDQVQALLLRSLEGGEDDEKLLLGALKNKNPLVKGTALLRCADLRIDAAERTAVKSLKDSNAAVKRAAAIAVGTYGGPDNFSSLVALVASAKGDQYRAGIRRGLKLADEREEVRVVAEALTDARKPEAKGLIAQALIVAGKHAPDLAGPAFAEALADKNAGIRKWAIRGIEATAHEAALPILVDLLAVDEFAIRADAVRAMSTFSEIPFEHGEKVAALCRDENPAVRLSATLATRALEPELALATLETRLEDEAWAVRDAAVEVLGSMRSLPATLLLAHHMERESGLVRDETYVLLRGLTGQDFGPVPRAWSRWLEAQPDDYELPSADEAVEMLDELAKKKASNNSGYGSADYHGIAVRPGGVLFILDTSGSMGFNYTPDAQLFHDYFVKQLVETIGRLNSDHKFGIVTFNGGATPWKSELIEANDESKAAAERYLKSLEPWGGTNLGDALRFPFSMDGVQQVYLMTDGDPTVGVTLKSSIVDWITEQNRSRRIRFHTIVAGEVDGNFLAEIAGLNGGSSVDLRKGFDEADNDDEEQSAESD